MTELVGRSQNVCRTVNTHTMSKATSPSLSSCLSCPDILLKVAQTTIAEAKLDAMMLEVSDSLKDFS